MAQVVITSEQLAQVLNDTKGCQFVNIFSLTEPTMRKTNNPYINRVMKLTCQSMQFGYDYTTAVNNRLKAQGLEANFDGDKLPWGQWVHRNKVIAHKDKLYIRVYDYKNAPKKTIYLLDGRIATKEEIADFKQFFSQKSESKKQSEYGLTENQVSPKVFKFENLVRVTINKTIYSIKG